MIIYVKTTMVFVVKNKNMRYLPTPDIILFSSCAKDMMQPVGQILSIRASSDPNTMNLE